MDDEEFYIKDKDTGSIYDIRNPVDKIKLNKSLDLLKTFSVKNNINYWLECKKIKEKIRTSLFKSCEKADIETIENLLSEYNAPDRIPNINEKYLHDYTVLHISVSNSHYDTATCLLRHNADINCQSSIQRTPLNLAVIKNDYKMVDLLISYGADVLIQDEEGNTALYYASKMGTCIL